MLSFTLDKYPGVELLDPMISSIFTFLKKVHLPKAVVFPVVMYGFESWTIRRAEH